MSDGKEEKVHLCRGCMVERGQGYDRTGFRKGNHGRRPQSTPECEDCETSLFQRTYYVVEADD